MELNKIQKRGISAILLIITSFLVICSNVWGEVSRIDNDGFRNLMESVVKISSWQTDFTEGSRQTQWALGSGVIIDQEGHILTNAHMVNEHTDKIIITLFNLENVKARKIGWDHWTDLAVLQIDMEELKKKGLSFKNAVLGDSSSLHVGDYVYAVGTPHGFTRTVTHGIISNNNRYENPHLLSPEHLSGTFNTWLQTDAAINKGNSGGALALPEGKLIGINTWIIMQANNLGFAIPIDVAKDIISQLIKKGQVTRSTIGIDLAPLQDLENFYNLESNRGALISNVDVGSPAAESGLRASDVILTINDKPVDGRFPEQIPPIMNSIAQMPVGESLKISYKRGNETHAVEVKTELLEERYAHQSCFEQWGLCLEKLTRAFAREHKIGSKTGLRVIGMQPSFPAQDAGLMLNDVIVSANKKPIHGFEDLLDVYQAYVKNPDKVLIEIMRGQATLYLVLKPSTTKSPF